MPNQHIFERLAGIQDILNGVHRASGSMSSATKGTERAAFVNDFLARVLPTPYRFGTGDVTDVAGNRSGQLDVVVEYPFAPCIPINVGSTRLYLAEGAAAAIEVKSDVAAQWDDAIRTADSLSKIRRSFDAYFSMGKTPSDDISYFVVGYTGWKDADTVRKHIQSNPFVKGVLVIDAGVYVGRFTIDNSPWSLWGLVTDLYDAVSSLRAATGRPERYAM